MTDAVKTRQPLGAAALSLLTPGLGQLYNGKPKRAVLFYAVVFTFYLLLNTLTSSVAIQSGAAFILAACLLALGLGFFVFIITDAYRGARRIGQLELRRYNRWYVYLLCFALAAGLNTAVEFTSIHTSSYSLPAWSMAPTLHAGDRIFTAPNAYLTSAPERGDVVVFEPATDSVQPTSNDSSVSLAIGSGFRTECCK